MKVSVVNKNGIFSFYDVTHIVVSNDDREIIFKAGFDAGDVPSEETQTQEPQEEAEGA